MTGRQNGHLLPTLPTPQGGQDLSLWGAPGLASGESEMLLRPLGKAVEQQLADMVGAHPSKKKDRTPEAWSRSGSMVQGEASGVGG